MSSLRQVLRAVGACAVFCSGAATGTEPASAARHLAAFLGPTVKASVSSFALK
jgi:hypothetical protein